MKICKECIQPDTRLGIYFDENGVCGACLWEAEKTKIDWNSRRNELEKIAIWAKENTTGNYDCAIGVSGGKDSTLQAIIARDELGLRPLLVNSEPSGITEIGKHNIENLKNLGFDVISLRPNPKIMKKLIKRDFYKYLNPIKITEYSLYSSTYIIAEKFEIPLIIQGENPGLTLGTRLTGVGTDSNALKANELQTLSSGWKEYLEVEGVEEKDLYLFHYDRKTLEEKNIRGIWLQYYLKSWSQTGNAEFSKKYGLKCRSKDFDFTSIGTYVSHTALDTDLTQVNQMLKYIKFGFGQCMDSVCYDLRENRITKKEALDLVKIYDGRCSEFYIKEFCNFINIDLKTFWKVTDKFRGPMWSKNSDGEWHNEYWDAVKKMK
jgi:N-acetyl sugar amidotransferase